MTRIVLFLLLTFPAWGESGLSRALSAAFQEFLAQPGAYATLHSRYTGIPPRYQPPATPTPWPVVEDGSPLDTALKRKVLRFGFSHNPPYQMKDSQGRQSGLDYDLGNELAERIGRHYSVPGLKVQWVEVPSPSLEQPALYDGLISGLKKGKFDAGFSGLLVLDDQPVASSTPTSVLFTDIFYTGRGGLAFESLRGGTREAFIRELTKLGKDFTFLSTVNPGPSASSAAGLVSSLVAAGGRAVARNGSIADLVKTMSDGSADFVVGDSVSLGYYAHQPGFRGLDLDIPAGDKVLQLAPFTLPGGYQQSELSQVLSAAFHEVSPERYSDIYEKYLGVRRDPPKDEFAGRFIPEKEATPGSTLDRVLKSRQLRFGFWRHEPYYYTGADGKDTGFEIELAQELAKNLQRHYPGLQISWHEQSFQSDGGGQENLLVYDALEPKLLAGEFDVMFSGIIRRPDRPVATAASTMFFFWNVIYTGKGGFQDVAEVQNTDRDKFLQYLLKHPGSSLISTPGGPSEETTSKLLADLQALGGSATVVKGTVPDLLQAASQQSHHFIVGDAIALSALAKQPGFGGKNLNISVRAITELIAPVTALDP